MRSSRSNCEVAHDTHVCRQKCSYNSSEAYFCRRFFFFQKRCFSAQKVSSVAEATRGPHHSLALARVGRHLALHPYLFRKDQKPTRRQPRRVHTLLRLGAMGTNEKQAGPVWKTPHRHCCYHNVLARCSLLCQHC